MSKIGIIIVAAVLFYASPVMAATQFFFDGTSIPSLGYGSCALLFEDSSHSFPSITGKNFPYVGSGYIASPGGYVCNPSGADVVTSINASGLSDGNYAFEWGQNVNNPFTADYWSAFSVIGGVFVASSTDFSSHIVSFTPLDDSTTTNPVTFTAHYYISPNDVGNIVGMNLYLHNIDQNVLLVSGLSSSDILLVNQQATTSGDFYFSTTTTLGEGNYRLNARMTRTYFDIQSFLDVANESHQFIVGSVSNGFGGTFIGNISQNSYSSLNSIIASTSATSTSALASSCNPLGGVFNVINCLTFFFIPDSGYLADTLHNFATNAATHFPLGYITDLISILSTTTVGSLPTIDATLPNGIAGGGAHLHLDPTHSLDYILNANMGIYGTSTQTFYQMTSVYWNYIVDVLALFYIIGRVVGSSLIPHQKSVDNNKKV